MPTIQSGKEYREAIITFLFERDGPTCDECGRSLLTWGGPIDIDHIVPRAKGGLNRLDNFQLLHKSCNSAKRDRLPWWDDGEHSVDYDGAR